MKKVRLYTEKVVNGMVVGEYKDFSERQYKKMLRSCHNQSKSCHKVIKNQKK